MWWEWIVQFVKLFLFVRVLQRVYFIVNGHRHHIKFSPKAALFQLFERNGISVKKCCCESHDEIALKYLRIGSGKKVIFLSNGVGTGFFMWYPIISFLLKIMPTVFEEITLIVPSYRGLFGCNSLFSKNKVVVTLPFCVEDILTILRDAEISKIDIFIGWSTGALTGLCFASNYPDRIDRLFLMNSSSGKSLHYVFQAIHPFPSSFGRGISTFLHKLLEFLKPLCYTIVWDILKKFALSPIFRILLELSAFLGGFPPEQPIYFHEYMRDAFSSRDHTYSLLNLILALDYDCPKDLLLSVRQPTVLVSGFMDVMTGVFHSNKLAGIIPKSKHVIFTMGSHFILLEWPALIAQEIYQVIVNDDL